MALQLLPRFNETDSLGSSSLKWLNGYISNIICSSLIVGTSKTPSSSSATGTTGEICWDSNYLYVCVATNTWKRASISW